jgi:hypothetical protein
MVRMKTSRKKGPLQKQKERRAWLNVLVRRSPTLSCPSVLVKNRVRLRCPCAEVVEDQCRVSQMDWPLLAMIRRAE